MSVQKAILVDRSRIVARQECPRMRYLGYDFEGRGLAAKAGSLPLIDGIILHEGFARLFRGEDLERVLADLDQQYFNMLKDHPLHKDVKETAFLYREQVALIEGILRAWHHHRLPMLLEEYEVVSVEQAFSWQMSSEVRGMMRMDAVLRRRDDGLLHIWDAKTMTAPSQDWMRKWEHDDQWLMYLLAAEDFYREPLGGVLVEGIVKGLYRTDTAKSSPFSGKKIQQSPYCYGYMLDGDIPMRQSAYTAKKGWQKFSVAESGMTSEEWFREVLLPEHRAQQGGFDLNEQFIIVPPFAPTRRELERWRKQTVFGEVVWARRLRDIQEAEGPDRDELLDCYAPCTHGRCHKYGTDNTCQFEPICFNETIEADPIGSGLYEYREPHHQQERDLLDQEAA